MLSEVGLFRYFLLLGFVFLLPACGGDSNKNDVTVIVPTAPLITTKSNISIKSGAFTIIEWQLSGDDSNVTVQLTQLSGEQDIDITLSDTDKNIAYFNAPVVGISQNDYQLQLTATNSQGLSANSQIELEVLAVFPVFKQPNIVFEFGQEDNAFKISTISQQSSYFFIKDYSNGGLVKALQWREGKLVEVDDLDSTYLQAGVSLFDINNDGFEDALYLKEFDIGDCEPMDYNAKTYLMVKLGTEKNFKAETQLAYLGCSGWFTKYYLQAVQDINDDHFLDFKISTIYPEGGEIFLSWLLFDSELGEYNDSTVGELFTDSGNPNYIDINNDQLTDIIDIRGTYNCANFGAVCGTLQYKIKLTDVDYSQWQNFNVDDEYNEYGRYQLYDVNLDDIDDVTIYAGRAVDSEPTHTHWFELSEEGEFKHYLVNKLPKYYYDMFASGKPYFVDISSTNFILYRYSEILKSPVIDEVQIFPLMDDDKYYFDVDNDGDIDVLTVEDNHIVMSENSY